MTPRRNRRLRAFPRRHSIRTGCVLPPLPTMMKSTLSLSACGTPCRARKAKPEKSGAICRKFPVGDAPLRIDFYRREKAPFWRDHLRRLHEPYENWANTRNCVIFESVETATDWERVRGAKMRTLRAVATLADSHTLRPTIPGIICFIVPTMRLRRHTKA